MHLDFLIVGQGLSGTFLSYYLQKEGKRVMVIDNGDPNSPSRISAGIINPVTGRRMVTVWKAEEVMPFAWEAYMQIGEHTGIAAITQNNIIDFFPNPFMRENFLKRMGEGNSYTQPFEPEQFESFFNFEFGCGMVSPVYRAHVETLLPRWKVQLEKTNSLRQDNFDITLLEHSSNGIIYKDLSAGKIIFCDGATGIHNPFFQQLPFAANKGEALILEIPGLPPGYIYKKSSLLTPLHGSGKDIFWCGSNYLWDFEDSHPTVDFRKSSEAALTRWLKIPFRILDHVAAVRPATLERRPFVGFHPAHPNVGILNGMGTKGASLAPYFAKQLVDHLLHGTPLLPEADISRFQRILSPSQM